MITLSKIVIIRPATVSDIEGAIDLLKEFQDESLAEYGLMIDAELAKQTCLNYVDNSLVIECGSQVVELLPEL